MKNYIYSFDEYVLENALSTYKSYQKKNYKIEIINALIESGTLEPEVQFVFEKISESNLYEDVWSGKISEDFINENLNEGKLVDWFKDKYEKAVEVIQDIKQTAGEKLTAAKEALLKKAQQAAQLFRSFGAWMGKILNAVKVALQKLWKALCETVKKKWNGKESSVVAGAAGKMSKDPEKSKNEVKHLGEMVGGGIKFVTGGAIEIMTKAGKQAATVEEALQYANFYDVALHEAALVCVKKYGMNFIHEVNENELILEDESHGEGEGEGKKVKIPGLSKLAHAMHELPIIKQLSDIEHGAAKLANSILGVLSITLNKVGAAGGPYKFAILGSIVGLGVEYWAKHKVAHALGLGESDNTDPKDYIMEDLSESDDEHGKKKSLWEYLAAAGLSAAILTICITLPGFAPLFAIMKKVATVLFWYTAISAALEIVNQLTQGSLDKEAENLEDKIKSAFKKSKNETEEKAEKLVDKAEEESEEEIKKGAEGIDDDDEEEKDKK